MTDNRFSDAYKKSVNSVQLPENFKDHILSNLSLEDAPKKKPGLVLLQRAALSAAAAVAIVACALLLFSVLRSSPPAATKDIHFRISSATNLAQVGGAKVSFLNSEGEYLKDENGNTLTAYTDEKGRVTAKLPQEEVLQIEVTAEGFIPFVGNASENIYVCPKMTEDTYRAVLTWTEDCDLDAFLTLTTEDKTEKLHYFKSDILNAQGEVLAALDTDSSAPLSPETVTFRGDCQGVWRLSVGSYSSLKDENSLPLAQSGATLTLYKGSSLVGEYSIDALSKGNVWRVLEIENGELRVTDTTYSVSAMTDIN